MHCNQTLLTLYFSPVILEDNWVNECYKFFSRKYLRAKAWTKDAFMEDQRLDTIWIVRDSLFTEHTDFWKTVSSPQFVTASEIVASFANEAHTAWRSLKSSRSQLYRKLVARSKFNVLVSGTPFPLGPGTDAEGVLIHCGGSFDENGRWGDKLARSFKRLVVPENWDVLAFRVLIAPFYLHCTRESTWNGKWVVDVQVARPVPWEILPKSDHCSEEAAKRKYFKRGNRKETWGKIIERADKQRFLAWTSVYEEVDEEVVKLKGNSQCNKKIEEIIKRRIRYEKPSGRLERFVALIKEIIAIKERFIIVSDRLFLLSMAYYVLHFSFLTADHIGMQ